MPLLTATFLIALASPSARPTTTYSIALHEQNLLVTDDMYRGGLADRPPLLAGVAEVVSATRTATGAAFVHTKHASAAHEHLVSLGVLRCNRLLAVSQHGPEP